ncbi:hypothetical protein AB0B66_10560 [Catellatospora sp. NPDC049111]|uniref:hypothetical protein n=1 Tax=Catellatospora sp. NPDC049111 TaxID=3155271 RepID=UPI0033EC2F93
MAIAHSFRIQPASFDYHRFWPKLVSEADLLIVAAEVFYGVTVTGPCGVGTPEISKNGIGFNGRADASQDRQPFQLHPPEQTRRGHDHDRAEHSRIRTDGHPYDLVVKAVLLRMRHHLSGTCVIGSSRSWRHWATAHNLVTTTFGGHRCLDRRLLGDTTAGLVLVGRHWTDPRNARELTRGHTTVTTGTRRQPLTAPQAMPPHTWGPHDRNV